MLSSKIIKGRNVIILASCPPSTFRVGMLRSKIKMVINGTIKVMESYVFSESLNTDENWNAAQIAIHPQENKLVVRYKNFFKFNVYI